MTLLDSRPPFTVDALEADVRGWQYRGGEIEAIARLLLRELPVRLQAGEWWGYAPERNLLVYPAHLLASMPGARAVGSLCHEIAEVLFAGADAGAALGQFVEWGRRERLEPATSLLLLNVVNDFRVNRRYLALYPGAARLLRAVYAEGPDLYPKNDLRPPRGRLPSRPLAHHRFLEGLIRTWVATTWPDLADLDSVDDATARAIRQLWPAVETAAATPSLLACAQATREGMLAAYVRLVEQSRRELEQAPEDEDDDPELRPPPPRDEDDDYRSEPGGGFRGATPGEGGALGDEDTMVAFVRGEVADESDEDPPKADELIRTDQSARQAAAPPLPAPPRPPADGAQRWSGGIIHRVRRLRSRVGVDYDNFDYIAAVHSLEPLIHATVHGRDGAPGLAQILNLRRFGTYDPFRRPRRFRRGDTGEIDEDHPERLLIDPAVAFLKGARQQRNDSLKDFANAILLDVSGSVVQTGYPSKKFDQLVETAVLFVEIHERLKLPYQIMCFSDEPSVQRSFRDCEYDNVHIDPSSAYVIKDFSYLIREMYRLTHGETQEAPALRRATTDVAAERGLKTILMVTDGISSDRPALVDALTSIQERNDLSPPREQLVVLAFGLGLAEAEFKASYEPRLDGIPLGCSRGTLVPRIDALPAIICQAIERRIRGEGRLEAA